MNDLLQTKYGLTGRVEIYPGGENADAMSHWNHANSGGETLTVELLAIAYQHA